MREERERRDGGRKGGKGREKERERLPLSGWKKRYQKFHRVVKTFIMSIVVVPKGKMFVNEKKVNETK